MDIDALLITHCAPTLARLKIGSLLCFHNLEEAEDFQDTIENIIGNTIAKACISAFFSLARNAHSSTYIGPVPSGRI